MAGVPTVDLAGAETSVTAALGRACEDVGFVALVGHGLSVRRMAQARELAREFFALPEASKLAVARSAFVPGQPNHYRGYFPLQSDSDTFKEGFEIGPGRPGPHFSEEPNVWPGDAPEMFRSFLTSLHADLSALGAGIMAHLAEHLGHPRDLFVPWFRDSVSTLRLLHYPGAARHALSAPAHVDSGILTLLLPSDQPGLEVRDRKTGVFEAVQAGPDTILMNLGGLLEKCTEGRLVATAHRVRAPRQSRISIPFFYEPGARAILRCREARVEYGAFLYESICDFAEYEGLTTGP